MYPPRRQFKALADTLRAELQAINSKLESLERALQQQIEATHQTQESDDRRREEQRYRLPTVIAKIDVPKRVEYQQRRDAYRNYTIQYFLLFVTTLAFMAAAFYAAVAAQQWNTMNNTYSEIQKQTPGILESANAAKEAAEDAHRTLTASQGAIFSIAAGYGSGQVRVGPNEMGITISNVGNSPIVNLHGLLHIIGMRTFDGSIVEKSGPFIIDIPTIPPFNPQRDTNHTEKGYTFSVNEREKASADNIDLTFGVSGKVTYWNGFETVPAQFCLVSQQFQIKDKLGKVVWSPGYPFGECDYFASKVHDILKMRDEWKQKEQKPQ